MMSKRLHSDARASLLFLSFSVGLQDTYHPKMCGFMSVQRFLLFFVCQKTPIVDKMYVSCNLACTPLSLFSLAICLLKQRKREKVRVECHYLRTHLC